MPDLCPECGDPMPEYGPTGRKKRSDARFCSFGPGSCKERVVHRRRYHRRKDTRPAVHAARLAYNRRYRKEWEQRQRDAGRCVRCADGVPFGGSLCDDCLRQLGRLPV